VQQALATTREFLDRTAESLGPADAPLLGDILAEVDILQTSVWNLDTVRANADRALVSPLLLDDDLVPPVCAVERPKGYDWFSVVPLSDQPHPRWGGQTDSRIILREQLSIMEHVLMQLAFGEHLACYGSIDWKLPINFCAVAEQCRALPNKRGIEFCVETAWRQTIGQIVQGLFNQHGAEPPKDLIPGISEAVQEGQAAMQGEGPPIERATIDYHLLELGPYLMKRE
jgi:hypothetical protein